MLSAVIRNIPNLWRSGIEIDGELKEFIGGADSLVHFNWVTETIEKGSTHSIQIIAQDSLLTKYPSDTLSLTVINGTFRIPGDIESIQGAINQAGHGDTILVSRGVYNENLNFKQKRLVISSEFLFSGDSLDIAQTIIDGGGTDAVVKINGSVDERALLAGFTIQNGSSEYGGGIQCFNGPSVRLQDLRIINNSATYGAGIYLERNADVEIKRTYIANNNAQSSGGGLFCYISKPQIKDSIIGQNNAGGSGGALYLRQSDGYELSNLYLFQNQASKGGGVYSQASSGSVRDIECIENSSYSYGAAFYSLVDSLQISGLDCRFNYAEDQYGQAVYISESIINLDGYSVEGNLCYGIRCYVGKVYMANGQVTNNNGYGLSAYCTELVIHNSTFTDNMGNGISVSGNGTYLATSAKIYNSQISRNTAEYGGGIRVGGGVFDLVLNDLTIDGNIASENGGGIYLLGISSDDFDLKHLNINNNQAGRVGGGIYIGTSPITQTIAMKNSLVYDNVAGVRGGGVEFYHSGKFNIVNFTFSGNEAPYGSAINSYNSSLALNNSIFHGSSIPSIAFEGHFALQDTLSVNYSMIEGGTNSILLEDDEIILWGDGNLDENPLFVDVSSDDYRLTNSSICIDAGDPNTSSNDSDGTRNDMGAFGGPEGAW